MNSVLRSLPVYLLSTVGKSGRNQLAQKLAADDLTLRHMAVLADLADAGPSAQRELCGRLSIDPSDMVQTLDDLEDAGLARRERDTADRRRYRVSLTPAGRRMLTRTMRHAQTVADEVLAPLSPAERETLVTLLQRLV